MLLIGTLLVVMLFIPDWLGFLPVSLTFLASCLAYIPIGIFILILIRWGFLRTLWLFKFIFHLLQKSLGCLCMRPRSVLQW